MSKTAQDFLGQLVCFILPNSGLVLGVLGTDNNENYGFQNGFGVPAALIDEVRKIEAPVEVNAIRAVFTIKQS
jgi:hypothetical protein